MSNRARQSAGTSSLFPFLAVLVCAMGALILLLLVTTRRIRQQTLSEQAIAAIEKPADQIPTAAAQSAAGNAADPPEETGDPVKNDVGDEPILPHLAPNPSPPAPQVPDPNKSLRTRLAALKSEQRELAAIIAKGNAELAKLKSKEAADVAVLADIQAESESLMAERERLNRLYLRVRDQQKSAKERAEALEQDIRNARAQLADADSKFAVVPYDGSSGTTRRPIIIECTEDSLTFASEGVMLRATDLEGFSPRYNPLLYATQALIRYWERRDRMASDEELGKPYVLLIVRPGGTTSYAIARGLLSGLAQPFGYELVTDDQVFAWPEGDAEATTICRTLVTRMVADREELMRVALQQGAMLPKYSDAQGRFHIKESEKSQRHDPKRELIINGQRYVREHRHQGTRPAEDQQMSVVGTNEPARAIPESLSGRSFTNRVPMEGSARNGSAKRSGDLAAASSTHTRQQTAVTRADRMTDWLRQGTTRLPPSRNDRAATHSFSATPDHASNRRSSDKTAEASIDPVRPQWGSPSARGLIGFEHEVRIHISAGHVSVGDDAVFALSDSLPHDEIQRLLAETIDREVRNWGDPPRSFYWMPSVRFHVGPGANRAHQQIKSIIEDWGLRTSAEFVAK